MHTSPPQLGRQNEPASAVNAREKFKPREAHGTGSVIGATLAGRIDRPIGRPRQADGSEPAAGGSPALSEVSVLETITCGVYHPFGICPACGRGHGQTVFKLNIVSTPRRSRNPFEKLFNPQTKEKRMPKTVSPKVARQAKGGA